MNRIIFFSVIAMLYCYAALFIDVSDAAAQQKKTGSPAQAKTTLGIPNTKGIPVEERAHAATRGNYVSFGNGQLLGKTIAAQGGVYRVERRSVGSGTTWQVLADVQAPRTEPEFRARFGEAAQPFQGLFPLTEIPTNPIWQRFERTKSLDSVGIWGSIIITQLALGFAYHDTTALQSVTYEYRVSTVESGGQATILFITNQVLGLVPPVLVPLRFANSQTDKRSVVLNWTATRNKLNAGARPFGVLLYRREDLKGAFLRVPAVVSLSGTLEATAYRLEDTTIRYGAIYQYYIVPFNSYAVLGSASDTSLVSTVPFKEASFINDIQAKSEESGIRITWRLLSPNNLAGLELWRSTDFKGAFQRIASVSPRDSSYTDRSAKEIDRYWYYLVARGLLGEVSPPSVKVFGIYENPAAPMPPFIVESEATKKGNRLVIGSTQSHLRGYRLFRNDGHNKEMLPISELITLDSSGFTVFLDTSTVLLPTHSYGYAAQAETRSHQLSSLSDTVYLMPNKPFPPLTAPANVVALAQSVAADSTGKLGSKSFVEIFWEDMSSIDLQMQYYRIFRRVASDNKKSSDKSSDKNRFVALADSLGGQQNYFTDTTFVPDVQYEYVVQSVGRTGVESPFSAIARAIVVGKSDQTASAPPSGVRAFRSADGVEIRWGAVEKHGLTGYNIYRYTQGTEPQRLAQNLPDKRSFVDTKLKRGDLYFYFVTVISDKQQESTPSREVSIRP
jgi:hypothetical protein